MPFPRVAFVVLFPTKLVSRLLDFICKRYSISGLRKRVFNLSPICFYNILLDYDVSMHNLVVLVVTNPTSPRLSKTEFVGERYRVFSFWFYCFPVTGSTGRSMAGSTEPTFPCESYSVFPAPGSTGVLGLVPGLLPLKFFGTGLSIF